MISAIGAFKHSLAIVTIYTNLGEDGVQHGITQVFFPSTTFLVILLASSGALYICQHCSMNDLILCYLYCSQTEASTVIVEEELLPRLLAVLPKAPSVRNVVVIPRL